MGLLAAPAYVTATAKSSSPTAKPAIIPAATLSWLVLEKLPAVGAFRSQCRDHGPGAAGRRRHRHVQDSPRHAAGKRRNLVRPGPSRRAFWPSRLALFYPHPLRAASGWQAVAQQLLCASFSVSPATACHSKAALSGWGWETRRVKALGSRTYEIAAFASRMSREILNVAMAPPARCCLNRDHGTGCGRAAQRTSAGPTRKVLLPG